MPKVAPPNLVGYISSIRGLFVGVRSMSEASPLIGEILTVVGKPGIKLYVESCSDGQVFCLDIEDSQMLSRNDQVVSTGDLLSVPSGSPVLGRVFNALGEVIDQGAALPETTITAVRSARHQPVGAPQAPEILETGIKVIDFMAPFVKGRRIGIIGGAGVGKTVLTTEMIHNVAEKKQAVSFFVGIGERIREGHELYHTLKDRGLIDTTVMYLGQMNDNAALRSIVGSSASAVARTFSEEGRDVLFFVDNIYRFVQARNELSAMRGSIPSEGGYQPSLFSDLHRFEDSLASSGAGSVTSVQSIYIPADDLSDPAVVEISQQLDSTIVLSREIFENGVFPAVDLLRTTSSLVSPDVIGKRHYDLVRRVRAIMRSYESLKTVITIVGESELSPADRLMYRQAQELTQFFSQRMFVTEDLSGNPGQYCSREETLRGVETILEATYELAGT